MENVVLKNGGDAVVNESLRQFLRYPTANERAVRFTIYSTSDGGLRVLWLSCSVNGPTPSFKGNKVPKHLRHEVVRIRKQMFPDRAID